MCVLHGSQDYHIAQHAQHAFTSPNYDSKACSKCVTYVLGVMLFHFTPPLVSTLLNHDEAMLSHADWSLLIV